MRNNQRGIAIVEVMVVLIISIIGLSLGMQYVQKESDRSAALAAGGHVQRVAEAASAYIRDNYSTVRTGATATTPYSITVAMLKPNYLPASFSTTNGYGQAYAVRALEPSSNKIEAIVVTTGGSALPEVEGRRAAQNIGASGGFISAVAPTAVTGAYGGWGITLPGKYGVNPGAGHLAVSLFFQDGSLVSDYLYRNAVPGHPELNRMGTSIDMGGYRIVNLQSAVPASACGVGVAVGDLARAASGKVLSCQSGSWKEQGGAFWGDPVNQAAAMPACAAANANETRVRYGYATAPTHRLFTCNGANWVAVGVDHAGSLAVPGNITMANGSTISSPGRLKIDATENLYLKPWAGTGEVIVGGGGGNGQLRTTGRLRTDEYVQINGVATENTGCSPNGLVGRNAAGLLLSCQSGAWKRTPVALQQTSCGWYSWGSSGHSDGLGTYRAGFCPVGMYVAGLSLRTWNEHATFSHMAYCCSP